MLDYLCFMVFRKHGFNFICAGHRHLIRPTPTRGPLAWRNEQDVSVLSRDLRTGSVCPQQAAVHRQGKTTAAGQTGFQVYAF